MESERARFLALTHYSKSNVECFYKVKFSQVQIKTEVKKPGENSSHTIHFTDSPNWSTSTIYYEVSKGQRFLYVQISKNDIKYNARNVRTFGHNGLLKLPDIQNLAAFHDLATIILPPFSLTNMSAFRKLFSADIHIYQNDNHQVYPLYKPMLQEFPNAQPISIFLPENDDISPNQIFTNFYLVLNPRYFAKEYFCNVTENCKFSTGDHSVFVQHQQCCKTINTQRIVADLKSYGENAYALEVICRAGKYML